MSQMAQESIFGLRGGREVNVDVPCVGRGGIVPLGAGDVVPADMRLIEAGGVKVSGWPSPLTCGSSRPATSR